MEVLIKMETKIIERPLKLDINSDDSDILKAIKKALKGYTTTKLRNLFMNHEEYKFYEVLKSIENSQPNSIYYLMLLERIDLASNAKSLLDEYNITKRR
jgi:hypothetical protein